MGHATERAETEQTLQQVELDLCFTKKGDVVPRSSLFRGQVPVQAAWEHFLRSGEARWSTTILSHRVARPKLVNA